MLLTRLFLWIFWPGYGVGRIGNLLLGLVLCPWLLLVPSCSLSVCFLDPLGSFVLYIVFYRSKKKKKKKRMASISTLRYYSI